MACPSCGSNDVKYLGATKHSGLVQGAAYTAMGAATYAGFSAAAAGLVMVPVVGVPLALGAISYKLLKAHSDYNATSVVTCFRP